MWIVHSHVALVCAVLAITEIASTQEIRLPPTITRQGMESVSVRIGDDVQRQQALAAAAQRQIEIRRDTDKMLQLTQELKEYLAKTEHGVMSIDAIKKAEQIEKLAKNVKSKIKQSF